MTENNNSKFMGRNVIGGLIIVLIGLFFLAVSGANYLSYLGMQLDIQVEPCEGCEPFDKAVLDAAIGSAVLCLEQSPDTGETCPPFKVSALA